MKNNARLENESLYEAAGINPKTKIPYKTIDQTALKTNIKKALRILDEQDAINRYVWQNLPNGLTGQLIERILYYKGNGMFFFEESERKFYFLPYALTGSVDVYGRYTQVTPMIFAGTNEDDSKRSQQFIAGRNYYPKYDYIPIEELTLEDFYKSAVLISDYSPALTQSIVPRTNLMECILDIMSEMPPFMRTALMSGTGINGMRVQSEDEQSNVEAASQSVNYAALTGRKWIPIVGQIDFQSLTEGELMKAEEYLIAMQAMDNLRLSMHGLSNGGLFQKKAHMLEAEQQMNAGNVGLVMQDGLSIRQNAAMIINSIWDLNVWVEPAETTLNIDRDYDGIIADNDDPILEQKGDQNNESESDV